MKRSSILVPLTILIASAAIVAKASTGSAHAQGPPRPEAFSAWRSQHWAALAGHVNLVRTWTISYRAHDGSTRAAYVVLPSWYGPRNHPPIPLVISPHGRGVEPGANVHLWGNLPALGRFAVVNPEGQGATQELYSWGNPGQIDDLARMPRIVRHALPWLRIAPQRIYSIGGSMGGQETLLLLAEQPQLLAGAISFDAPTNMSARYIAFAQLKYGLGLQRLARLEIGSVPTLHSDPWADRSPIAYAHQLAYSHVPLQIWWSTRDRTVVNQASESGLLYRTIKQLNPAAPVKQFVGTWGHTAEMQPLGQMPIALQQLGLLSFGLRTQA